MDKNIACCGIDCSTCEAYKATIENNDELRRQVAKKWCEMNHTDQITPESINCTGCRQEGAKYFFCSHMCQIRKCAQSKGFETCGECSEIDHCEKVKPLYEFDPSIKEHFSTKRDGVASSNQA